MTQTLLPPADSASDEEWQHPEQEYIDPSFCSGKFSARSTSFGGMNNTRDENFSDFSKVPSFQVSNMYIALFIKQSKQHLIYQTNVYSPYFRVLM